MLKRKWKEVYERLPIERKDKTLSEISGFTNFCTSQKIFRTTVLKNLSKTFHLKKKSNICEVGCGCGDKLSYFYHQGHNCFGIDFSNNMILRGRQEMPKAKLFTGEANKLPFKSNSMDIVFAYSVFIYFENEKYLNQVLSEMYRIAKPEGMICIWDVPDIMDKQKVISFRGKPQKGYEHTYYDMNTFFKWFKEKKIKFISSEYIVIPEYRHSYHRFNINVKLNKSGK